MTPMTDISWHTPAKWRFDPTTRFSNGAPDTEIQGQVMEGPFGKLIDWGRFVGIDRVPAGEGVPILETPAVIQSNGSEKLTKLKVLEIGGRAPDRFEILRIGEKIGIPSPAADLEDMRRAQAEACFEDADLEGWSVAGTGGWEDDGEDRLARPVFLEMPAGPSLKVQFAVSFEPGMSLLEDEPDFDLPRNPETIFGFYVNLNERGDFYADVRDAAGTTIWTIRNDADGEIPEIVDGHMKHKGDISGLEAHLASMGVIPNTADLLESADFEAAMPKPAEEEPAGMAF